MKYKFLKNKFGFTLIELLVVVAIISLLASIVLGSLQTARAKARDAKRMQELNQLYNAVELFAFDKGSYYIPLTDVSGVLMPILNRCAGACARTFSCEENGNWPSIFRTAMAPYIYMPTDPLQICGSDTISSRKYVYMSNGTDFKLQFINPEYPNSLRAKADPHQDGGPTTSMLPGNCNGTGDGTNITAWSIYTRGAECWTH